VKLPILYGDKDAKHTVICWGSTKGPALQAMQGNESLFNVLHFTYMWPLPAEKITDMLKDIKSPVLVENNSTGQLGQLLKMVTGVEIDKKFLKYSGRPIYPEEILDYINKL
jgi:2-oxoglutarate ferredoxin oxidoreductase subunit alpha